MWSPVAGRFGNRESCSVKPLAPRKVCRVLIDSNKTIFEPPKGLSHGAISVPVSEEKEPLIIPEAEAELFPVLLPPPPQPLPPSPASEQEPAGGETVEVAGERRERGGERREGLEVPSTLQKPSKGRGR